MTKKVEKKSRSSKKVSGKSSYHPTRLEDALWMKPKEQLKQRAKRKKRKRKE